MPKPDFTKKKKAPDPIIKVDVNVGHLKPTLGLTKKASYPKVKQYVPKKSTTSSAIPKPKHCAIRTAWPGQENEEMPVVPKKIKRKYPSKKPLKKPQNAPPKKSGPIQSVQLYGLPQDNKKVQVVSKPTKKLPLKIKPGYDGTITIAFPSLSTRVGGIKPKAGAETACRSALQFLSTLKNNKIINLVLLEKPGTKAYNEFKRHWCYRAESLEKNVTFLDERHFNDETSHDDKLVVDACMRQFTPQVVIIESTWRFKQPKKGLSRFMADRIDSDTFKKAKAEYNTGSVGGIYPVKVDGKDSVVCHVVAPNCNPLKPDAFDDMSHALKVLKTQYDNLFKLIASAIVQ